MDRIYNHLGQNKLWGSYVSGSAETVGVTELWRNKSTGLEETTHRVVQVDSLPQGLKEHPRIQNPDDTCILRVLFTSFKPSEPTKGLPSGPLRQVLQELSLELAFDFFTSCFAGATALPVTQALDLEIRSYTFSYHPKLALIWSHANELTQAVCFAFPGQAKSLRKLLDERWALDGHAMLLPFLCSLLLTTEIDETQNSIKVDVREVESRTGYHRYENRTERPAQENLSELEARVNGCTTKLASVERKLRTIENLNQFILANPQPPGLAQGHAAVGSETILRNNVSVIQNRLEMQRVDNEYTLKRVQAQIRALGNIIGQSDGLIAIEMARDSRRIAVSSQRDSFSMKTLAIVTIVFLPGSFVASLLAIPVFNWDSPEASDIVGPRFGIYWAVAGPLTLITMLAYGIWILLHKRSQHKHYEDAERELGEKTDIAEFRRLTMKRRELTLNPKESDHKGSNSGLGSLRAITG